MPRREPAARPSRGRCELYFDEVSQLAIKLAGLGDASQNMFPASDMQSASNRKRTLCKHQGAALANLLQVAGNGFRHPPAGNIDDGH